MEKKNFSKPDEIRALPKTKLEIVTLAGSQLMKSTFEPGWKWSENVKPTVGTESCQTHHVIYAISGRMKVVMEDGAELEFGPDDIIDIPAGHDAWVIGEEQAVGLDMGGATTYAKPS